MNSYIKNTHPDVEQLAGYMESPESGQHNTIRKHLMACDQCRTRVDKLIQLEFDIRHYVPRFQQQSTANNKNDNADQVIERYIDDQLDNRQSQSVKQQIQSSPDSLKAALHYAVHSSAMQKDFSDNDSDLGLHSTQDTKKQAVAGSIFGHLFKFFQLPMPVWSMAPATLLLASIVSLPLIYSQTANNDNGPLIAKFQDNAVISYSSADIPAGSIGFFHDAKSRIEPFKGINITITPDKGLDLNWPPVNKGKTYTLKVYQIENNEKQEIVARTTTEPMVSLDGIKLEKGKHYQWQINGLTNDGLKFSTQGDFLLLDKS